MPCGLVGHWLTCLTHYVSKSYCPNNTMACKIGSFVCMTYNEIKKKCEEKYSTTWYWSFCCSHCKVNDTFVSANVLSDARVDVSARVFWPRGQKTSFDVTIFSPIAMLPRVITWGCSHTKWGWEDDSSWEEDTKCSPGLLHASSCRGQGIGRDARMNGQTSQGFDVKFAKH